MAASLQSWGEDCAYDYRLTNKMPGKSGIVGLISACMGYKREDPRILELNHQISIAVRADKPGMVIEDFTRVTSESGMITADGKPRNENTLALHKFYLEDARFQVFVYGEDGIMERVYDAMRHPKFLISLGRKACVPSEPIVPVWVTANSIFEAVRMFTDEDRKHAKSRVIVEMDYFGNDKSTALRRVYSRRDNLKDLKNRFYGIRKVCSFYVDAV